MPFRFTCPYCFRQTWVDDRFAGQTGPCVGCGKTITVDPSEDPAVSVGRGQVGGFRARSPFPVLSTLRWVFGRMAPWIVAVIIAASLCAAFSYLFWPSLKSWKMQHDRAACLQNLQRISRALNAYEAAYGTYPPPIVYDATGKPLYSWRVLVLPYLEEQDLYSQFKLDEPWDSETNSTLIPACPAVFACPASDDRASGETDYALLVGPGTLFPPSGPLAREDIADGAGATLLVAESRHTKVLWTEPGDVDVSRLNRRIGAVGPNSLGGYHAGGASAVAADGTPLWLPDDLDPVLLDALLTPRGGDHVAPELIRP